MNCINYIICSLRNHCSSNSVKRKIFLGYVNRLAIKNSLGKVQELALLLALLHARSNCLFHLENVFGCYNICIQKIAVFSFCRPSLVLALNILTWSYLQPLQCVLGKTWDSQKFRAVAEAWELSFSSTVSSHHHKQAVPLATTAHSYCCSIYWLSHRENLKRWHCAWLGSVHIFFCTVSKQMKISLSQVVPKSFPEAPGASFSASSQWSSCRADHVNHIIINHPLQWRWV